MRYGLIGSILLHIAVFGLVIFNFVGGRKEPPPMPAAVSIEVTTPGEFSEQKRGKADGVSDAPAVAEKKEPEAPATAKKDMEQKPAVKPSEKEALPPPPKVAEIQPPEPKTEPVKHEPAKAEKEAHVEKAPEKPKPLKKIAERKPPVKKVKPEEPRRAEEPMKTEQPQRAFDPNRIASILKKEGQNEPNAPPPVPNMMNAQPSKLPSNRQTALLNRDPNAGTQGGDFEPGKPWRPASSLEDQAKGASTAYGAVNSATDADLLVKQISDQWDLPPGNMLGTEMITIRFRLRPDGMLAGEPEILNRSNDPGFAAAAGAAMRAVFKAQPFRIPPGRYEAFRDNTISFDPRGMYGGGHG